MRAGNASPPPPAKTKKSVRIESPTSTSPHPAPYTGYESNLDRSYRENDAGHPGARSPAGFSDSFDSYASAEPHDSRGGGDSAHEAGEMIASKRRDSDMASPMHSVSGAPINPFAKTLATIEPQERDRVDPAHAGQQKGALEPRFSIRLGLGVAADSARFAILFRRLLSIILAVHG